MARARSDECDHRYDQHAADVNAELASLRACLGDCSGRGLQVGIGTGRFSKALGNPSDWIHPARCFGWWRVEALRRARAGARPQVFGRPLPQAVFRMLLQELLAQA